MTTWTFSSCSEESFDVDSNGYGKLKFEAILPSSKNLSTRVNYIQDEDGLLMTAWESSDEINVFGMESQNSYNFDYKQTIDAVAHKTAATWENNNAGYKAGEELVAVYPASASKGNLISIDFSNQDGTIGGLKNYDLMVSEKVSFDQTEVKFHMERKNVFIRIEVEKAFKDNPKDITITVEGNSISNATYDLTDNSYIIDGSKDKIEFTNNKENTPELNGYYLFYIVVPCTNSKVPVSKITISKPNSNDKIYATFDTNVTRVPGQIYSTRLKAENEKLEAIMVYGYVVNERIISIIGNDPKKLKKVIFKINSPEPINTDLDNAVDLTTNMEGLFPDWIPGNLLPQIKSELIAAISEPYEDGYKVTISTTSDKIITNNDPSRMFSGFENLEEIENISLLDTSGKEVVALGQVIFPGSRDMHDMFRGCTNLKKLDLTSFNTRTITNFSSMFEGCASLTRLDLSAFDTGNATDMSSMFSGCSNLSSLNVTSFNTAKVTNMSSMFSGCSSLPSLNVTTFNTGNVTNFSSMFEECEKLGSINCSSFNTGKATNMSSMFKGCTSLNMIDIHTFNTSSVTDFESMFEDCTTLKSINISSFNTPETTLRKHMQKMFYNCNKLAEYNFGINFNLYSFCFESSFIPAPYIQDVFANTPDNKIIITSSTLRNQMTNKQNQLKLYVRGVDWTIIQ